MKVANKDLDNKDEFMFSLKIRGVEVVPNVAFYLVNLVE